MPSHCEHEHHDHGHDSAPPIATNESQSLNQWIDTTKLLALNMANLNSDLPLLFKTQDTRYDVTPVIRSDLDGDMIVHIPFECPVKLYSITLRTSSEDDHSPQHIKLYKNVIGRDFDDIQSLKCDYELTHPRSVGIVTTAGETNRDPHSFVEHHLPRRLFSGIAGISVYFTDLWNGDEGPLELVSLELRGEASGIRGGRPVVAMYEASAQLGDHKKIAHETHQSSIL